MTDRSPVALGHALAEARKSRKRLSAADLAAPADFEAAAAAQAALFDRADAKVEGWKVGIRPDGAVAAPMTPILDGDDAPSFPYRSNIILEVEIAFRLSADLPRRGADQAPYTREEIAAAAGPAHLGLEIVDSTLNEGNKAPFTLFLADLMGNGGYVVGPEMDRDLALEATGEIVVEADGVEIFRGKGAHPSGDPLLPILAYANGAFDALGGLKAGQIVTTGAICLLPLPAAGTITVTMNGLELETHFAG